MLPAATDGEQGQHAGAFDFGEEVGERVRVVGRRFEAADRVLVEGEVDVGGERLAAGRIRTARPGRSGSIGPAGATMFGFSLPGFQPTVPSFMKKRRLKLTLSSRPRPKAARAGASFALARRTLSAILRGSSAR